MVNIICINTQIYAIRQICKNIMMQLKICRNMQKICIKYAAPHDYASYVKIWKNMQKYAIICKICQHDFYMQNMHFADELCESDNLSN